MSLRNNILEELVSNHPKACQLMVKLCQAIDLEEKADTSHEEVKELDIGEWIGESKEDIYVYGVSQKALLHTFRVMRGLFVDLQSKGINFRSVESEDELLSDKTDHPAINFSKYGEPFDSVSSDDLISSEDCVARVELSGSEGFYVEVVKWDDKIGWHRHAFEKFFEKIEAECWEAKINSNSEMAAIFYTFSESKNIGIKKHPCDYLVYWDIEVDAKTPLLAAKMAHEILLDTSSTAVVFEVQDRNGNITTVDLMSNEANPPLGLE